ncbi:MULTISPECIES: DnaB-like helicase C-terminal domain-containing protein [Nostoc]|nr:MULTISPECIES: DnaB-like helicase C-terminal domain-containing protein [Nostoc]
MILYREEMHNPDTPERGIAELIVRKQRNGPTGNTVRLRSPRLRRPPF